MTFSTNFFTFVSISSLSFKITYGAFSHDVTAAILVFQNNKTVTMLVYQRNPVGAELFSYVNAFFCFNKFT